MDTLKEYILIESATMNLDCYQLNEKGKSQLKASSLEAGISDQTDMEVHLTSVNFHCHISLLYEDVDVVFPQQSRY
ncbi:hypothetical protein ACP6PL_08020 [Dapis sp. BLCC M126]|uniref:hypothetical protein n=1 Tax=Dapis sp. BLCC M126 TaxID=3400189 RepID=UPI003CE8DD50